MMSRSKIEEMLGKVRKPRVKASSIPWLMRLWQYGVEYDAFVQDDIGLHTLPADVFDGHCIPSELADLVRRRFLQVIPVPKEGQNGISTVTWFFTKRGMAIFRSWEARAPLVPEPPVYPEDCCPNCGASLLSALSETAGDV